MYFLHFFDSHILNKHSDTLIEKESIRKERRWALRVPLWLKVSLYQNGDIAKYGLATNFSLGGLHILCNQNGLNIGQKLEIIFDHDFGGMEKHFYIPTEIKRITNEGIAVSFCQHDINSFSCIQKMLFACNKKNVHERAKLTENTNEHEAA